MICIKDRGDTLGENHRNIILDGDIYSHMGIALLLYTDFPYIL